MQEKNMNHAHDLLKRAHDYNFVPYLLNGALDLLIRFLDLLNREHDLLTRFLDFGNESKS